MAIYNFTQDNLNITVNDGTLGISFNYSVDFGSNYTSGIITRQEDKSKWNVIKDETLPDIKLIAGTNIFKLEFETNKEVILTENAVKQLITNIKDADNQNISKTVLSGAYNLIYSNGNKEPTALAPNTEETKKFLSMTGTGSAGTMPIWSDLPIATGNTLGLVKIGGHININEGEISIPVAEENTLGIVSIGNNININDGEISIPVAKKNTLGLVKIGDNINLKMENDESTGEISVSVATKKSGNIPGTLGVVSIGDNINLKMVDNKSTGEISIPVASTSAEQPGVVKLSNALNSDDETTAATSKAIKDVYELANNMSVLNFELNNYNWDYKYDYYYCKDRSFFTSAYNFNHKTPSSFYFDQMDNEILVTTGEISEKLYNSYLSSFNTTLYKKVNKDAGVNPDITYYKLVDGEYVEIDTTNGFPDNIDNIYIRLMEYNNPGNNYYVVSWIKLEKTNENNELYPLENIMGKILNTKPELAGDDANVYYNFNNIFFEDNDTLIVSPKTDNDWNIWRTYGIRSIESGDNTNNILKKILFKADSMPKEDTSVKILRFKNLLSND